jgi:glycerol-1-phosphate dehydrogenase [NAD(P)+]
LLQVRARAHDSLAAELGTHFDVDRVMVVTGRDRSRSMAEALRAELDAAGSSTRLIADVEGTLAASAQLLTVLDESPATVVVAVGGGQPIDVAKLAAARAGVDLVAVPTTLSHDGMSSPVSSLRAEDGRRRSLGARMPSGVVIDLDVIAAAPLRYLRAGVGDLVSNITAVDDWRAAEAAGHDRVDEFAASIAVLGAHSALEIEWPPSPPDVETLARALVMSGLAMEVAGSSRPCSGAEHLVSHALDEVRGEGAGLHGEHVALGVLLTAGMHDGITATRIRDLFGRVGLPLTLEDAGIDRPTMVEAVRRAPSTRPGRSTALDAPLRHADGAERLVDAAFGSGAA